MDAARGRCAVPIKQQALRSVHPIPVYVVANCPVTHAMDVAVLAAHL